MNVVEIYDFLYDWIHYVMSTRFEQAVQVIVGSQNAPIPTKGYIVIHEPVISNRKVGNTQKVTTYIQDDKSFTSYSNTWECVIELEEVNGTGRFLQQLHNSIEEDDIQDIWRAQKDVSFQDMQAGSQNNAVIGNIIDKRYVQELFLYYTEETTIEQEIIETVEITKQIT